jgi:hypothetical protein
LVSLNVTLYEFNQLDEMAQAEVDKIDIAGIIAKQYNVGAGGLPSGFLLPELFH